MLVFNFHHVEARIRHPSRRHITITPAGLKRFIRILRMTGHRIVSLRDVLEDGNGYENNLREAIPVLWEMAYPTMTTLPGRFSGVKGDQGDLPESERDRLVSRTQVTEITDNPSFTLGRHGLLHRDMTRLSDDELHEELNERILRMTGHRDILKDGNISSRSARDVILTFDDGYENNLREALPVLREMACPATVFVLPGRFSGANEWDQGDLPESERDRLMSREQMAEITDNPYVTLGSHGLLHRDMTSLNDDALHEELHESHRILQAAFGDAYLPVFAYPWGTVDQRVAQVMESSPYRYAFTVETARWQPDCSRFLVPRYSVYYRDGNPLILLAKLMRHGLIPFSA